jgi:hypothetical protein
MIVWRIWYGTAPMPVAQLREGLRRFGPVFRQNYGMSEASQPLTVLGPEDHVVEGPEPIVRRLRSAGRPALGMDLRVVNEAFEPVKPGERGEIVYRSRHMFQRYWKLPEETARAFRGEWFLTGDLGTVDEDGYVYIVGRKDDLIISGGFNIQPREVEEAILNHPAVAEVAVVGVPDERWGEAVKAVCVLRPGAQVGADEIVQVCRQHVAGYKKPRIFWAFVAAMYVGNLMLLALNLPLVGLFARIATLRPQVLMPVVGVLCLVGAYSTRSSLFDVWVMVVAGTVGFWLRRWGFPPAPLAIGMVLGPMTESNFRLTMQTFDGDPTRILYRPLAMAFLVAAVLFQLLVVRRARVRLAVATEEVN